MSFLKWILTLLACAAIAGGLGYYKYVEIRSGIEMAANYPEQSATVEAGTVATAEYQPVIVLLGDVVAPRRLDLSNEFAGEIMAVGFRSGERVEAGQLLLQLDISLEQAQLEAARARAEVASLAYERNRRLVDSGVSNQEVLDRARADLATANAEIAVLERTIAKKTLRAPFSGRAGLHTFEPGQYLSENSLVTSLVGDSEELWVDFQVPQFYPPLVTGDRVGLKPAGGSAAAGVIEATVIAENTVLNTGNRSRAYRASLPLTPGLAPQAMVQVEAPVATAEILLQVPSTAIQNDPLGQYVFVLRDDPASGAFRAQRQGVSVRVIRNGQALLEPGSGLQAGQRIATAGAFKLYQGILTHVGGRVDTSASGSAD